MQAVALWKTVQKTPLKCHAFDLFPIICNNTSANVHIWQGTYSQTMEDKFQNQSQLKSEVSHDVHHAYADYYYCQIFTFCLHYSNTKPVK